MTTPGPDPPESHATLIRPLGVGWERVSRVPRAPRVLSLFWPLLPTALFLAAMVVAGQPGVGIFFSALWLVLTLPRSSHLVSISLVLWWLVSILTVHHP